MSDIKESFIDRYHTLREEKESMASRYLKAAGPALKSAKKSEKYYTKRASDLESSSKRKDPHGMFIMHGADSSRMAKQSRENAAQRSREVSNREKGIERASKRMTRE